jgi:hypothetical protein
MSKLEGSRGNELAPQLPSDGAPTEPFARTKWFAIFTALTAFVAGPAVQASPTDDAKLGDRLQAAKQKLVQGGQALSGDTKVAQWLNIVAPWGNWRNWNNWNNWRNWRNWGWLNL